MITLNISKLLNGRSQYWLAQQTGIDHTTIGRLVSGESQGMRFGTLDKICEALGCEPGDLIVRADDPPSLLSGHSTGHAVPLHAALGASGSRRQENAGLTLAESVR